MAQGAGRHPPPPRPALRSQASSDPRGRRLWTDTGLARAPAALWSRAIGVRPRQGGFLWALPLTPTGREMCAGRQVEACEVFFFPPHPRPASAPGHLRAPGHLQARAV